MTDTHGLVRTRMAPSPTGEVHVGTMATLLKNYAWAKKNHGQFVLRIEDTDQEREVPGATARIQEDIRDYGLTWDEGPDVGGPYGPYVQSERLAVYREHAETLIDSGQAYYCFCTRERLEEVREQQRARKEPPKYDRHCRAIPVAEAKQRVAANEPYVIRLRVPDDEAVTFTDMLRGDITFQTSEVDDQVLLKSDGFPTYHLAVVVDDYLMKISHIMRGEEWISSTPKHILLYRAFGWDQPTYAHMPLFLNPNGKGKMSKRKGDVSARSFLEKGYLPEAMLNFFMILGWAREDQEEIMTLEEYVDAFDPRDISPKGVAFDTEKLNWLNGVYIRRLSEDQLLERLKPFLPSDFPMDKHDQIVPLIAERLVVLGDVEELTSFFYRPVTPDPDLLLKKANAELVADQLEKTAAALHEIETWNHQEIEATLRGLQEKHDWKKGQYFMMIRVAVSARKATPPLFEMIAVFDQATAVTRLEEARSLLT